MSTKPSHIQWLSKAKVSITTPDGKSVDVYEFNHQNDEAILSAWAKHFREHYCLESDIDYMRAGPGFTRGEYLVNLKFPTAKDGFGPATRSGDFGEILVADYLEYILDFWVPRTRYADKVIRNESKKGSDIIGFKFVAASENPGDILALFESKAQFSGTTCKPKLQEAVDGSVKDEMRRAETLNAIKQRLYEKSDLAAAEKVARFQDKTTRPYSELYGAAALFCESAYDETIIADTITANHPHIGNLTLLVIKGNDMMQLIHALYARAANEA